jgi:hypothetical protein
MCAASLNSESFTPFNLFFNALGLMSQHVKCKKERFPFQLHDWPRTLGKQKGITDCRGKRGKLIILFLPTTFYPPPYSLTHPFTLVAGSPRIEEDLWQSRIDFFQQLSILPYNVFLLWFLLKWSYYNRNQSTKKLEHMKQSPACKSTRRIITARVVSSNL